MKIRERFVSHLLLLILVMPVLIIGCLQAAGQEEHTEDLTSDKLLPPNGEKFQPTDALAAPWRKSGCYVSNLIYKVPNCRDVSPKEWDQADYLSIYNADGSLWYSFSLTFENPNYFLKNKKTDFLPYAINPPGGKNRVEPDKVILRIINESPHWYQVEVNEETRATKYILKNDSKWAKTEWIRWLHESIYLYLDKKSQIFDKADGKVITETSDFDFQRADVLKAEGDWAYVECVISQKVVRGWIQWREGRDVLVGWTFNDWKVPESKTGIHQ